MSDTPRRIVHRPLPHDSAAAQVTGEAVYVDDIPEPAGTLEIHLARAPWTHAELLALDLEPVRRTPGVVCALGAADIPGINDIGPTHRHDDPVFAEGQVMFWGQPLFAVAAERLETAREAAARARIEARPLPP
ncbi:MAG TPA: xanthine dehydrogenase molybdopterin binding subunit, partial [Rhodospirillales bacterium]|nr:xanthine dehydrogenase molybdopterin binding subunit [Rhodospirillales bacterium]